MLCLAFFFLSVNLGDFAKFCQVTGNACCCEVLSRGRIVGGEYPYENVKAKGRWGRFTSSFMPSRSIAFMIQ